MRVLLWAVEIPAVKDYFLTTYTQYTSWSERGLVTLCNSNFIIILLTLTSSLCNATTNETWSIMMRLFIKCLRLYFLIPFQQWQEWSLLRNQGGQCCYSSVSSPRKCLIGFIKSRTFLTLIIIIITIRCLSDWIVTMFFTSWCLQQPVSVHILTTFLTMAKDCQESP